MVDVDVSLDQEALDRITRAIGNVAYKSPTILKDASNATGRYAMKQIFRNINKRYDYDDSGNRLKKTIKRKSATYANPSTIITATSHAGRAINFHVTPRVVSIPGRRPEAYKGHILKNSGDKVYEKNGIKAFIMRIQNRRAGNTHEELVVRKDKSGRSKVQTMFAPSETQIAQKGFELSEEKIQKKLQENLRKYIQKFLDSQEVGR